MRWDQIEHRGTRKEVTFTRRNPTVQEEVGARIGNTDEQGVDAERAEHGRSAIVLKDVAAQKTANRSSYT